MISAAGQLLHRYPPSFAKSEAVRVLRRIGRLSPPERELRFVVHDIVYAFQLLEAQRLGIRPDRHPYQYAEFRHDFVVALAMWVPGKDPFIDGVRAAASVAAKHNDPALDKILQDLAACEMGRLSVEQSRRASSPREPKSIDGYIRTALIKNPDMTLDDLWNQIRGDEFGEVIENVEHDRVWVRDITNPYSRGSIRKRYYDIRKKLKSSR